MYFQRGTHSVQLLLKLSRYKTRQRLNDLETAGDFYDLQLNNLYK